MRSVIVTNNVSLDGVMQAPARADEDTRGGFDRGGWAQGYDDEVKGRAMAAGMARQGDLLLGRRTYEDFFAVWPKRTDNPFTPVLNNTRKYVASRTLGEPLAWENSTLLAGDAADTVAALKQTDGADLGILGSGELIRSLQVADLIDEYHLLIHPLVLGSGARLFENGGPGADFDLVESTPTTKGVIIATYRRKRPRVGSS